MENNTKLALSILPDKIGICHLDKNSPIPDWAQGDSNFTSVTRTMNELSIILPQEKIPAGILAETDWRVFKVQGPLGFSLTGIVASLAKPLADADISIFYIDTYETSYLLVEDRNLQKTKEILGKFCEIKE